MANTSHDIDSIPKETHIIVESPTMPPDIISDIGTDSDKNSSNSLLLRNRKANGGNSVDSIKNEFNDSFHFRDCSNLNSDIALNFTLLFGEFREIETVKEKNLIPHEEKA